MYVFRSYSGGLGGLSRKLSTVPLSQIIDWSKVYCSGTDQATRLARCSELFSGNVPVGAMTVETLIAGLSSIENGILTAMQFHEDTSKLARTATDPVMKSSASEANADVRIWLAAALCADNLTLRRVTFESSSGDELESVVRGEAVHSVRTLKELKRRLHHGRRCFALFHHCLPSEPLAFVHIALMDKLAESMDDINSSEIELSSPTHALFYSINNPHDSLRGLNLGPMLIRRATEALLGEFESLRTLSTLSPVPGFVAWLAKVSVDQGSIFLPAGVEHSLAGARAVWDLERRSGR